MHMHVLHLDGMRTTIELNDTQRAKLLEMAAERGEKGFSRLVQTAIDHYLAENRARRDRVQAALAVLGSFDEDAAIAMEDSVREARSKWR